MLGEFDIISLALASRLDFPPLQYSSPLAVKSCFVLKIVR